MISYLDAFSFGAFALRCVERKALPEQLGTRPVIGVLWVGHVLARISCFLR
jgi:hypothetical protein